MSFGLADLGLVAKTSDGYTVTEAGIRLSTALADMRHDDAEQLVRTTVVANGTCPRSDTEAS